ncbi:MAG TPA: TonB-dependent receptor, partial [Rhizomicrobium sp.]
MKLRTRSLLMGTTLLAGIVAFAAPTAALAQDSDQAMETVVVTGYRASLESSTNAKRDSVNFSDTVFAEDIGKFPDTNIAEAFNRIPGVTITRENDGSGMRVAIRGLDTNHVKITLNGAVVSTASTGNTDASGANREVDLNIFPIELFSQLTVSKTSTADQLEGGASGVISMRSLRPFDNPGTHLSYNVQLSDYENNGNPGYRGTLIGSWTDGPFGVLVGLSGQVNRVLVTGYEGAFNSLTTPNLTNVMYYGNSTTPCAATTLTSPGSSSTAGANTCNSIGGNADWNVPYDTSHDTVSNNVATGVPFNTAALAAMSAAAGYPITTGMTIDRQMLLDLNPGLSIDQVSNAIVPRTGRPMFERGLRNRYNGILSLEYRPSDDLHFYFDSILGVIENSLDREDLFWIARNGFAVPMNMQVDEHNVLLKGDMANAAVSLEARPYKERSDYFSLNPGMDWQVTDLLHVDAQVNYSRAHFFRDSPTFLFSTPLGILHYDNTGSVPVFTMDGLPGANGLQDPANYGWYGGSDLRLQQERRYQYTKGAHANAKYGGDEFAVQVGAAWDQAYRLIRGYDNGRAFANANCGNAMSVVLPGPNTTVGCGVTPGAVPAYPGWGTGFSENLGAFPTAGTPALPHADVPNYLLPGPNGFARADYAKLKAVTNYEYFAHNPSLGAAANLQDPGRTNFSRGTNTNISSGIIDEKTTGFYGEIIGTLHRGDQKLRYNIGARWIRTQQTLTGYTLLDDPRNANGTADPADDQQNGGQYPQLVLPGTLSSSYSAFLPSVNLVWEIYDDFQIRGAVSRTMTRANPASMLPQLSGGGSDAKNWNLGNPDLRPFYSTNIDLGAELYTGGEGYIGVGVFKKMISGFPNNFTSQQPFSYLAPLGVTYDVLSPAQQDSIAASGGP